MDALSTELLFGILILLLGLSAFFSSSETGMLSLNRYRLRHLEKSGHKGAVRASALLTRTDRLISVILIGNNLVNIFITLVASAITFKLFGENAWIEAVALPVALTIIMLIFAEVTPKSMAAVYPEKIAFPASYILRPLMAIFYPLVILINQISSFLAKFAGVNISEEKGSDHLHPEELRTVVDEAGGLIPDQHQGMLLNVLDLSKATVEDILIPRNEIVGIDLEDDINDIVNVIRESQYTRLPVYENDISQIVGILHIRSLSEFFKGGELSFDKLSLRKIITDPYFIPESTPLSPLLHNFQKNKQNMGVVVDEYGEVLGIATLVDLLEEIVGDFSTDTAEENIQEIREHENGWYEIDASASIRDINKQLDWNLPTDGPKTLNGIIVEYLESIPDANVSFDMGNYRFEIKAMGKAKIDTARVFKRA